MFPEASGTRWLCTDHAIPLNYQPVIFGGGIGVPTCWDKANFGAKTSTGIHYHTPPITILALRHGVILLGDAIAVGEDGALRDVQQSASTKFYSSVKSSTDRSLSCVTVWSSLFPPRSLMRHWRTTSCRLLVNFPSFNHFALMFTAVAR